MIIRREQMQTFEAGAQAGFETEMLEHLKSAYPRAVAGIDDLQIRRLVSQGVECARGYGFQARGPVRMLVEFQVILGHEFDRDPLLYWIRDILRDSEGLDETTQAGRLHQHVSTYLELVYGPDGEHVAKGLQHIANAPPEELAVVGKAYGSKAIPWLQALHARKCAYAGASALTNLMQEAWQAARNCGLPEPEGPPLMLGLMFAFGSGVMTDPLHPWAAASLAPESGADARTRMERLIARTQAYMRQALENSSKG
jgi:hypothetical protein